MNELYKKEDDCTEPKESTARDNVIADSTTYCTTSHFNISSHRALLQRAGIHFGPFCSDNVQKIRKIANIMINIFDKLLIDT